MDLLSINLSFLLIIYVTSFILTQYQKKKYSYQKINYFSKHELINKIDSILQELNYHYFLSKKARELIKLAQVTFLFNKKAHINDIFYHLMDLKNELKKKRVSLDSIFQDKSQLLKLFEILNKEDNCDYQSYYKKSIKQNKTFIFILSLGVLFNAFCFSLFPNLFSFIMLLVLYSVVIFLYIQLILRDKDLLANCLLYEDKYYYHFSPEKLSFLRTNSSDKLYRLRVFLKSSDVSGCSKLDDLHLIMGMDNIAKYQMLDSLKVLINLVTLYFIKDDGVLIRNKDINEIINKIHDSLLSEKVKKNQEEEIKQSLEKDIALSINHNINNEIESKKRYLNILLKE